MVINPVWEAEIRNIIHLLIRVWPGNHTCIPDKLTRHLSDSFRYCSVFESISNSARQTPIVISGSKGEYARTILNGVGHLYDPVLISFIRYENKWLLDSITSLCTSCIENGYLNVGKESEVCPVCGGLGWGVLDCTP